MEKWKCSICGKVFEAQQPPVPCPICGAPRQAFETYTEETQPGKPAPKWRCNVCGNLHEAQSAPAHCSTCGAATDAFEAVAAAPGAGARLDSSEKYVIVGAGAAALAAAKAIRRRDTTGSILMLGAERHAPYRRPLLPKLLEGGKGPEELAMEPAGFYAENGIELRLDTRVEGVDAAAKTVLTAGGESLPYTKLLLAVGSFPFNPIKSVPGAIPVLTLRTLEDAELLAKSAAGKRVVLVGGGILGLEAALALRALKCAVTVVEFAPRILPLQADEAASALLQKALEDIGMSVRTGLSVAEAGPAGVTLSNGTQMAADVVLASMGVRSQLELAQQLGLACGRGILVDEFMRTSLPDIWAAGDCAEFGGVVRAQAGAAMETGAAAGAAMTGDLMAPYTPFTPATTFGFEGFSLFSTGDVQEAAPESVVRRRAQPFAYQRLFLSGDALVGALFLGGAPAGRAVNAVKKSVPLEKAVELFSE